MLAGLMVSCGIIGLFFYVKMFQYFISSKKSGAYPPVKILREKAKAMGGIGTIFVLFFVILYLYLFL